MKNQPNWEIGKWAKECPAYIDASEPRTRVNNVSCKNFAKNPNRKMFYYIDGRGWNGKWRHDGETSPDAIVFR